MTSTNDNSSDPVKPSGSTMVVTATPVTGAKRVLAYDANTPAESLIRDLCSSTGWDLELHSVEINQEITEIKKRWYEGIKVGASLRFPEGEAKFEIKPEKEVKTTIKAEWRKPDKSE